MTPERAKEIIRLAKERANIGPWSDQIDKVISKEERVEINNVWETMPGYTCFVDALYKIANGES